MSSQVARAKIAHFVDKGCPVSGVVHVGANDGEEIPYYLHLGPVVAFEPQKEPFDQLCASWGSEVWCVLLALGSTSGVITLTRPADESTKGASALAEVTPGEIPLAGSTERVPMTRFDLWAADREFDASKYNTLVVDVQGMELDVLKGFGDRLDGFDYLNIECSEVPVYVGEASAQEVIGFLASKGFRQDSPIEPHNDIMFIRA